MNRLQDTITAQATVSGEGGIAIIRISGSESLSVLERVFVPRSGRIIPRRLTYGHVLRDGEVLDEVMAVYMPGPHTYTAENMAEIQCHGSQYIVSVILELLIHNGIRLAEPGEFTYRAFVNGRVDLTQAEAVMRIIQSSNERSRKSAVRQMDGAVSRATRKFQSDLMDISAELSANIDFPDEVDEIETTASIREKCRVLRESLLRECNSRKGRIEDDGVFIALCGKPNAGKSTLLNALVGEERAIVTDIPGTTRDTISDSVLIDGIRFTFTDTAGLRETDNEVERIGVERARKAIQIADIRILLIDSSEFPGDEMDALIDSIKPDLILLSKEDIRNEDAVMKLSLSRTGIPFMQISAEHGRGMEELRRWLVQHVESDLSDNCVFSQTRHVEMARLAAEHLQEAIAAIDDGMPLDLVNVDLMAAMNDVNAITGESVSEAVIDRVFSRFCVGK